MQTIPIWILLILINLCFSAQIPVRQSFIFENYNISNGLPDNFVEAIAQDRDNQIWLGTRYGLAKILDGQITILKDNQNISNERVFDLNILSDGSIVSSTSKGIFIIKDNHWQGIKIDTLLFNSKIQATKIINDTIWIGFKNKILKYYKNEFIETEININNKVNEIRKIFQDSNGMVYFGTDNGVFLMKNSKIIEVLNPNNCEKLKVWSIFEYQNEIFISGERYPDNQKNHEMRLIEKNDSFILENIENSEFYWNHFLDPNGSLWFGFDDGVQHFKGKEKYICQTDEYLNFENGLNANYFLSFLIDNNGFRWFGTENGVWIQYYPEITQINTETYKNENFNSIFVNSINDVILSNFNSVSHFKLDFTNNTMVEIPNIEFYSNQIIKWNNDFIFALDDNYLNIFNSNFESKKSISISSNSINSLLIWNEDSLYVGTDNGGYLLNKNYSKLDRLEGLHNYNINHISKINNLLFLSTDEGLIQFDAKTKKQKQIIKNKIVNTTFIKDSSSIYIGLNDGLIYKTNSDEILLNQSDGLSSNKIMTLDMDSYQQLWIGTSKGICVLKDNKFFPINFQNNLVGNYIYDSFQKNEQIYFSTLNGIIIVDPFEINSNLTSKPIIKNISVNNKLIQKDDLIFNYKNNNFNFEIISSMHSNAIKNKYKYKLNGFDNNWVFSSGTSTPNYANLNPGKYQFILQSLPNEQNYNYTNQIDFQINPPFWNTWFFRIISSIIIIFILTKILNKKIIKEKNKILIQKSSDIEIQLFNQFNVKEFGKDIPSSKWNSKISRVLFSYLILKGIKNKSGVKSHKLSLDLWPDASSNQAKNRKNSLIAKIRKVFNQNEDVILFKDGAFSFNWNHSSYQLDLEYFNKNLKTAKLAKINNDLNLFIYSLKRVIKVYGKSGLLPELDHNCLDDFKSKIESKIYNETIYALKTCFESENYSDTIFFADYLISWENWHEIAHEYKYLSNIALGNRSIAIKEIKKFIDDYKSEFSSIPEFENSINI